MERLQEQMTASAASAAAGREREHAAQEAELMAALEAQLGAERRRADETDAERRSLQESVEVLHRQLRET